MLTILSGVLMLASSLTGLQAARLWWLASRQPVPDRVPPWMPGNWTGDPDVEVRGEIAATTAALVELSNSMRDGARLNARAALWTGASVAGFLAATGTTWLAAWFNLS